MGLSGMTTDDEGNNMMVPTGPAHVTDRATLSDNMEKNLDRGLKLGADGLPLVPQPTDHRDDPLVSGVL